LWETFPAYEASNRAVPIESIISFKIKIPKKKWNVMTEFKDFSHVINEKRINELVRRIRVQFIEEFFSRQILILLALQPNFELQELYFSSEMRL
jgi:hypothetical protein